MLLNVQRTGGVFRHYYGLDRPPSLINLKRVDHDPGLFATPRLEWGTRNEHSPFSTTLPVPQLVLPPSHVRVR